MVIQLSKLFRINVAGLLAADGVTLVLDEVAGTELVTTLAGALGLTVGAGGAEMQVQVEESAKTVQAVKSPDIITEAVAAAISAPEPAPAVVVKPTIPPPPQPDPAPEIPAPKPLADRACSVQRIHAYLTEVGASFMNDIAAELGYNEASVYTALMNTDLFAIRDRVARNPEKHSKTSALWDLRERVTTPPVAALPLGEQRVIDYLRKYGTGTASEVAAGTGMTFEYATTLLARVAIVYGKVKTTNKPARVWRLKSSPDETADGEKKTRTPKPDGRKTKVDAKAETLQRVLAGQGASSPAATIATVEAGQAVVADPAPDFLPTVTPAPKPSERASVRQPNIAAGYPDTIRVWLTANGPADCAAIGAGVNLPAMKIRDIIRWNRLFVCVGKHKMEGRKPTDLWGVVGVHVATEEKPVKPVKSVKSAESKITAATAPTPAPAPVAQTRKPIRPSTAVRTDRFVDRLHKLLVVNGPRFADDLAFTTGENLATVVTTLNAWESEKFNRTGRTIQTPGGLPRVEWEAISEAVG